MGLEATFCWCTVIDVACWRMIWSLQNPPEGFLLCTDMMCPLCATVLAVVVAVNECYMGSCDWVISVTLYELSFCLLFFTGLFSFNIHAVDNDTCA